MKKMHRERHLRHQRKARKAAARKRCKNGNPAFRTSLRDHALLAASLIVGAAADGSRPGPGSRSPGAPASVYEGL